MTIGMEFPLGVGISGEFHGHGKNIVSIMGIGTGRRRDLDGNGNNLHSHWK